MPPLLLLQIYLALGLAYGSYVIATAELKYPTRGVAVTVRQRLRIYLIVLAIGMLLWPVGLVKDGRGRS